MENHEYFDLIDIDKHQKYQLGEELSQKVFINNKIHHEEKLNDYFDKLGFSVEGQSEDFILDYLIKHKKTIDIFYLFKTKEFFNKIDDLTLYIYSRKLSGRPISKQEIKRIKKDKEKLEKVLTKNPDKVIFKKEINTLKF